MHYTRHPLSFLLLCLLLTSCNALRPASNPDIEHDHSEWSSTNTPQRSKKIVAFAKRYQGTKYKYGGKSPKGFDCSGFTSYVYKHFGKELPHQSGMQEKVGKRISRKEARAGDLVFFRKSKAGKVFHVALIVSNDRKGLVVIHATSSRGVVIDNIDQNSYWKSKYMTFRRVN